MLSRVSIIASFVLSLTFYATGEQIYHLKIKGVINPITSEYILRNLKHEDAIILIQLDTPGGLAKSMEEIVKKILNSKSPIIVYIAPTGAAAASAGTFIAIAADILAMAPGTRIGAAHPVTIGGQQAEKIMMKKIINDLVTFATGIARQKNRNTQWVKEAIVNSSSISEIEALKKNVCDVVAKDIDELLKVVNGRYIPNKGTVTTIGKNVCEIEMNLREKFLHAITEPNIAYILLMLGLYGLIYEFLSPGIGLGGVVGSICLILAFLGLHTMPINLAGLLLLILGIILLLLEIKMQSHGILTAGGCIAIALGSIILIDIAKTHFITISWQVTLTMVICAVIFSVVAVSLAIRAQLRKTSVGRESMLGQVAVVTSEITPQTPGVVYIDGEYWNAFADESINIGEQVKVVQVLPRLRLKVQRIK